MMKVTIEELIARSQAGDAYAAAHTLDGESRATCVAYMERLIGMAAAAICERLDALIEQGGRGRELPPPCPTCDGSGGFAQTGEPCHDCRGSGFDEPNSGRVRATGDGAQPTARDPAILHSPAPSPQEPTPRERAVTEAMDVYIETLGGLERWIGTHGDWTLGWRAVVSALSLPATAPAAPSERERRAFEAGWEAGWDASDRASAWTEYAAREREEKP